MAFFEFNQNNSGGSFIGPEFVIVEAETPAEANDIAERHGVYFDGCALGVDCSCCGDRWHPLWPEDQGDDEPSLYGKPVSEYVGWWGGEALIVRSDGSTETVALRVRQRQ